MSSDIIIVVKCRDHNNYYMYTLSHLSTANTGKEKAQHNNMFTSDNCTYLCDSYTAVPETVGTMYILVQKHVFSCLSFCYYICMHAHLPALQIFVI